MTETDPKAVPQAPTPRRRRVRVKRSLGLMASPAPTPRGPDPKAAAEEPARPQRQPSGAARAETAAPASRATNPEPAADEPRSSRIKSRVRRRATSPFHLSRKHLRLLTALLIAVIAATAVASFLSASLDNPQTYVPGGAIH